MNAIKSRQVIFNRCTKQHNLDIKELKVTLNNIVGEQSFI